MVQYALRKDIEDLKARVEALETKQKPIPKEKIKEPKSKPEEE